MSLFSSVGAEAYTPGEKKSFVPEFPEEKEWYDVYIAADPVPGTQIFEGQDPKPILKWVCKTFRQEQLRSDGGPFWAFIDTSTKFGDDRSHLTSLIDAVFGRRLTPDEFMAIKPGELIGKTFRVMFELYTKKSGEQGYKVRKGEFSRSKLNFVAGSDFTVEVYEGKKDRFDKGTGPTAPPPSVGYNRQGNAVIPAPAAPARKPITDDLELEDPFAEDGDGKATSDDL